MCGICGIIRLNTSSSPPIEPATLDAMTDSMSHRGPDGRGTWLSPEGAVGLGHRRLAIVDLSPLGAQPMSNEDGTVQVTFNGEIYNHVALRHDLENKGHHFRSRSDTEVLVHLYEEYGVEMIEKLDGDFGFGLWDGRGKKFLMARDRAGVKPVYYTQVDGQFLFSSEIRALLAHPLVKREVDKESLYHYLTYLVVPAPKTLVRNIYKLPAAAALVLDLKAANPQPKVWQFWEALPGQADLQDDLDEQLRDLFERSVEKRLMSDVPVGVLFSGGVDSTLNAVYFQQRAGAQRIRTYHVGMPGAANLQDESETARAMAKHLGTEHYEIAITEKDLLGSVEALAKFQDEPVSDPVCLPLYFITKHARETGTIVLHAGEGADEIFCGYSNYRRFLAQHQSHWKPMQRLPKPVSRLAASALGRSSAPQHRKMADALRRLALGQEFFMSSAVGYYEDEKKSVLSRDFRRDSAGMDSFNIVAPFYKRLSETHPNASVLEKMTFVELQLRLPELLLMRVDKMAMANSVEVRVPFLDRDLVDFALSVPESFKLRDGISKEPVKRLAAQFVDREAIYNPKRGFGVPIQDWFRGDLGDHLRDMLNDSQMQAGEYFDTKMLRNNLDHGLKSVNQAFQLWVVYNFLHWQQHLTQSQ